VAVSRGSDLRGQVDCIGELLDEVVEYLKDRGAMKEEVEDTVAAVRERSEELFYQIPLD